MAVKKKAQHRKALPAPPVPVEIQQREIALPADVGLNMQALMMRAVDRMVPIEYLERLIGLIEQQRARWSRERFFDDLARFQQECPVIEKKAEARDVTRRTREEPEGELLYTYARYEDIVPYTQPILTRYGFSATVKSVAADGKMTGKCLLHHRDGHTEETEFTVPIGEGTKRMSGMQKVAAARSFARRWAYIDALGLAMKGEDVDHEEEPPEIKPPQATAAVDAEGRPAPAAKPAAAAAPAGQGAAQRRPAAPEGGKVAGDALAAHLREAREKAQAAYDLMKQPVGKPLPDGTVHRLFSAEEMRKAAGEAAAARDDAGALLDMAARWGAEHEARAARYAFDNA